MNREDKRRCFAASMAIFAEELLIVVWDKEADHKKTDDIKEGDTPKYLLDGSRQGLARIFSFRRGKTDEFRSRKGKGSVDEDTGETLKPVVKGPRVVPVPGAYIFVMGTATAVDNDSEDTKMVLVCIRYFMWQ